jgi:lipid-A-disaccharide synthase
MKDTNIFILAGEHSGDLHGSHLMQAIYQKQPSVHFVGVGGPKMREQKMDCLLPMEEFEVMGFLETLKALPKIRKQLQHLSDYIIEHQPKAVILIDYPGFNIRLARTLRKMGYKGFIIQYISPTVWAWGKGRIKKMVESLDLLLTILPFEPKYFSHSCLKTEFVGHPLIESMQKHVYNNDWHHDIGLDLQKPILAVFPGSRHKEIVLNLHKQLFAAKKLIDQKANTQIAISCARAEHRSLIEEQIEKSGLKLNQHAFIVPGQHSYELMRACRTALAKSGTVNLELALHQKPAVIVYEVSAINGFIARYVLGITLTHFSLVNILGEKEIYPEFITYRFSKHKLYEKLKEMDEEGAMRYQCIKECGKVADQLKGKSASLEASEAIFNLME